MASRGYAKEYGFKCALKPIPSCKRQLKKVTYTTRCEFESFFPLQNPPFPMYTNKEKEKSQHARRCNVPFPEVLTKRVVEGVGDRLVPLALEEAQTGWGHGVLVLPVEVHRLEGRPIQTLWK